MWAVEAYGMPPAKVGVDSRAAQLIGFSRKFMVSSTESEPMKRRHQQNTIAAGRNKNQEDEKSRVQKKQTRNLLAQFRPPFVLLL